MVILSKNHLKKIRQSLPHRYAEGLRERISNKEISDSLIFAVMNGQKKDYHGIISAALDWIAELKKDEKDLADKIKKLTSNN